MTSNNSQHFRQNAQNEDDVTQDYLYRGEERESGLVANAPSDLEAKSKNTQDKEIDQQNEDRYLERELDAAD